ncbi:MAG: hypothetical protein HGA82_00715, partial [Anaerolineales bacterium]|nr:hypothetical protein [Anaerolineales bacterium]
MCSGRRSSLLVGVFLCAALSGTPAIADPRDQFKSEAPVHGQVLPLRGTGRLVWMRIVTVYAAALYLPAEVPKTDSLTDVPKRLELRYHVSIKGKKFGESAEPYLEKNVKPEALARLRPRIEQLNRLYRDVREVDRYALRRDRRGLDTRELDFVGDRAAEREKDERCDGDHERVLDSPAERRADEQLCADPGSEQQGREDRVQQVEEPSESARHCQRGQHASVAGDWPKCWRGSIREARLAGGSACAWRVHRTKQPRAH